jgi:subtilisin family serine protease
MSLGGGSNGVLDLLARAVNRFDQGGMVIAIAAGNSGPDDETIESPGYAERAIAVGASSVGHFVGYPVTTADGGRFGAVPGEFETADSPLTAPLDVVMEGTIEAATGIGNACTALAPGSLAGEIALISRGTCSFSTKIRNAETAGAVAVLIVNNVAGDPTGMASDLTPDQPTIPAYMVGLEDGLALANKEGVLTTIGANLEYFRTANDNIMASFSSLGPTDVQFRVKPDVVAPGVNVLNAQPAWACEQTTPSCWAFYAGTSMATPHVAGVAALLAAQGRSVDEIYSTLTSTARTPGLGLRGVFTPTYGYGIVDAAAAVAAP